MTLAVGGASRSVEKAVMMGLASHIRRERARPRLRAVPPSYRAGKAAGRPSHRGIALGR
jgi:hypothetical protein